VASAATPRCKGRCFAELSASGVLANRNSQTAATPSHPTGEDRRVAVKGSARLFVENGRAGRRQGVQGDPSDSNGRQDSRRLFYLKDESGNENYHVLMVDSGGRTPRRWTDSYPGIQATHAQGHPIRSGSYPGCPQPPRQTLFDLYKINIDTGQEVLIAQNPGIDRSRDRRRRRAGRHVRKAGNTTRLMAKRPALNR